MKRFISNSYEQRGIIYDSLTVSASENSVIVEFRVEQEDGSPTYIRTILDVDIEKPIVETY